MTALRLRSFVRTNRPFLVAAAATAIGVCTSSAVPLQPNEAASTPLTYSAAADVLLRATSGDASVQVRAVGEQARRLNAALPFRAEAIAAASPFVASTGELEQGRALLCLTQAIYYEAGFEPLAGRRAVAQVVLNRVRHPAFPHSICGVVYQVSGNRVCQFTFVCDGSLNRPPEPGAWRQARSVAAAALAGYVERSVGAATHYHADYVTPRWAPLLTKLTQIGAHIFYRWPGGWGQPRAFAASYIGEPRDPLSLRPRKLEPLSNAMPQDLPIAASGPPVRRAPNDVGGLLDTSKGWRLSIPDPREASVSAAKVVADQQVTAKVLPVAVASAAAPRAPGR